MRFLVFQHVAVEHPGVFRDLWQEDRIAWDVIELDAGEPVPRRWSGYDALVVMGGPQDVWKLDEHPWLLAEKRAIAKWVVEEERPFLGICLGHQLLAEAVGGSVGPMAVPEVGIATVKRYPLADEDPLLRHLPTAFECLQWHGAEVKTLPRTAQPLAGNDACAVQAFRFGRHAYGFQYHCEITPMTVVEWAEIPAYRASLEAAMGPGAVARLNADAALRLDAFRRDAAKLHRAFTNLIARPHRAA